MSTDTAIAIASSGHSRSPAVLLLTRMIHRRIVVAGRTEANVAGVVDQLRAAGQSAVEGSYSYAAACDVVCAATRSDTALFGLAQVRPGTHVNLVGSYRLDLREVAADLVAASTVVVDEIAAARAEAGDLHLAVQAGVWSWDKVADDLTDLASGRLHRRPPHKITLFQTVALARLDLAMSTQPPPPARIRRHSRALPT